MVWAKELWPSMHERLIRAFLEFFENQEGFILGAGDSGRVFPLSAAERDELVRGFLAVRPLVLTVENPRFACSFCGKPSNEVKTLIAGPTVFICDDECIGLCRDIAEV